MEIALRGSHNNRNISEHYQTLNILQLQCNVSYTYIIIIYSLKSSSAHNIPQTAKIKTISHFQISLQTIRRVECPEGSRGTWVSHYLIYNLLSFDVFLMNVLSIQTFKHCQSLQRIRSPGVHLGTVDLFNVSTQPPPLPGYSFLGKRLDAVSVLQAVKFSYKWCWRHMHLNVAQLQALTK